MPCGLAADSSYVFIQNLVRARQSRGGTGYSRSRGWSLSCCRRSLCERCKTHCQNRDPSAENSHLIECHLRNLPSRELVGAAILEATSGCGLPVNIGRVFTL